MNNLVVSCFIFITISCPLFSLPIDRSSEVSYQFPDLVLRITNPILQLDCIEEKRQEVNILCETLRLTSHVTKADDEFTADQFAFLPDSRPDLEEANNLDRTYLLQSLPAFLDKHNFDTKADDVMIKDDATQIGYNPSDNLNEAFYGTRPKNVLLSRLLSKERKQYKKRGNLSECFWKYCV